MVGRVGVEVFEWFSCSLNCLVGVLWGGCGCLAYSCLMCLWVAASSHGWSVSSSGCERWLQTVKAREVAASSHRWLLVVRNTREWL